MKPAKIGIALGAAALWLIPVAAGAADANAAPKETPTAEAISPEYRIGIGDVLQINVWKEAEVSVPSVTVRLDGRISLPMVREVQVAGLRPKELESLLTKELSRFIREPEVTAIVREVNSQRVYVIGAVKKEGAIQFRSNITVLQALAEAGGLTDYAKRKEIYVLRSSDQKPLRLPFNYNDVIRGRSMEQNILIQPDDTIVVPQ